MCNYAGPNSAQSYSLLHLLASGDQKPFQNNMATFHLPLSDVAVGNYCRILIAVKIRVVVFRVMTPCSLVGGRQRLGGTCILDIRSRLELACSTVFRNV